MKKACFIIGQFRFEQIGLVYKTIRFIFEFMLKVIHFVTMKVKLSFLFLFVLVTSQLPVLQLGVLMNSFVERFVKQRFFIATFCRFTCKQYFYNNMFHFGYLDYSL